VSLVAILNVKRFEFGRIVLSDGAVLVSRVAIVDVKKAGDFPPFGGVNLTVKAVGGISLLEVPKELMDIVADKPVVPPDALPSDGWEYVEIKEQKPAFEEVEAEIDNRKYWVYVEIEPLMSARNLKYRSSVGEPFYIVNWVNKVKWKPLEG